MCFERDRQAEWFFNKGIAMFANMKIGLRLTLGFAIVLVMMAALAAVGINGMTNVQSRLDEIVTDNMVKMGYNDAMSKSLNDVQRKRVGNTS